ncbi:DegV family protein [Streptomyces sp. SID3343]|uniref:DegV family protein n=1 Tax=Streptomyces sp. SID3343 TaxID=2690260 RepID=UPI0013686BE3|nr:DegV family protein [Streptomyces sp. SID3343]MYV96958.1 DegV family EDD domain-containing protein [Streptomyces sp. SID3343]
MPTDIAVVTDSTAYLPVELVERHRLVVVPLKVVLRGRPLDDGTEATPTQLVDALRQRRIVTTSRPAPETFAETYRELAEKGATGIVSIHISGELSGTYEAALLAARDAEVPVRVVDSRTLGMGMGFAVLTAAEAAADGATVEEAAVAAEKRAYATAGLFYVDTLEYLRRGGRIGAAAAFMGTALAVKPLLHVSDGLLAPLEKVRTSARAISRLEELAVERAGAGPVDIAVHHLASAERAEALAGRLRERLPGLGELYVSEVGAVIGAHAGPGLLAVVVSPR